MTQIKVAIVDNEDEWLKIISKIINEQADMIVLGSAYTTGEAIDLVKSVNVDIVLMDINLAENKFDGIDAIKTILMMKEKIKIIMVTAFNMEELILNSFLKGAAFFLGKENIEELPDIIRNLNKNLAPYEVLLEDYRKTKDELLISRLTVTEKEIYLLKQLGYTTGQIALKTRKSEGTIRNQLSKVYKKLKNKHIN